LTEGDYKHTTTTAGPSKEEVVADAKADIQALRAALRALLSVLWTAFFSESSSLLTDFASFTRLSLADAAELVETSARAAKQSLREIETGVQKGKRTPITGRSKDRVKEEEADIKLKWEHGIDTVKGAGDTVIDATRTVTSTVKERADSTKSRVREAFLNVFPSFQLLSFDLISWSSFVIVPSPIPSIAKLSTPFSPSFKNVSISPLTPPPLLTNSPSHPSSTIPHPSSTSPRLCVYSRRS
jgi:hypothetical protein